MRIGRAESNVAIGLARLGVDATWVSRVGDDALGTFVTREIRAEGVRVLATRDAAPVLARLAAAADLVFAGPEEGARRLRCCWRRVPRTR